MQIGILQLFLINPITLGKLLKLVCDRLILSKLTLNFSAFFKKSLFNEEGPTVQNIFFIKFKLIKSI